MDTPFNIYVGFSAVIILLPTTAILLKGLVDQNTNEGEFSALQQDTTNYTLSSLNEAIVASSNPILKLICAIGTNPIVVSNTKCFAVVMLYRFVQHLTLGELRASELQHLRETFWDYLIQKGLFMVFLGVKTFEETTSPWPVWFTILGSILLLSRLCKDRFEYLASSPSTKTWSLIRIGILMGLLLIASLSFTLITIYGQPFPINETNTTNTLFLLANVSYVLTVVLSVITRLILLTYDMSTTNSVWENRASLTYYSDFIFSMSILAIDLLHHSHSIVVSHIVYKISCSYRLYALVTEILRRQRRHKNYKNVMKLVESTFPMASEKELVENSDDCAICWDEMNTARKLPCGHLFHNSCLRSWLEQDTSCPTCRTLLKGQQDDLVMELYYESGSDPEELIDTVRIHQRNQILHFDSSRYINHPFLNWMQNVSTEFMSYIFSVNTYNAED